MLKNCQDLNVEMEPHIFAHFLPSKKNDDVSDGFRRVTFQKENKNSQNLIDGLEMIYQEILSILKKHGIEKITALNKKFNHDYHQAMLEIDTDDVESGVVVKELQAGYTMHGRLLRPAMVGVSKKKEEKNK